MALSPTHTTPDPLVPLCTRSIHLPQWLLVDVGDLVLLCLGCVLLVADDAEGGVDVSGVGCFIVEEKVLIVLFEGVSHCSGFVIGSVVAYTFKNLTLPVDSGAHAVCCGGVGGCIKVRGGGGLG